MEHSQLHQHQSQHHQHPHHHSKNETCGRDAAAGANDDAHMVRHARDLDASLQVDKTLTSALSLVPVLLKTTLQKVSSLADVAPAVMDKSTTPSRYISPMPAESSTSPAPNSSAVPDSNSAPRPMSGDDNSNLQTTPVPSSKKMD